jgi:hypothetical protein
MENRPFILFCICIIYPHADFGDVLTKNQKTGYESVLKTKIHAERKPKSGRKLLQQPTTMVKPTNNQQLTTNNQQPTT